MSYCILFTKRVQTHPQVSVETLLVHSQLQPYIWGRHVIFVKKTANFLKRRKRRNDCSNSKFQKPNKVLLTSL